MFVNGESDRCPLAFPAFDDDFAAVALDYLLAQHETDSRPRFARCLDDTIVEVFAACRVEARAVVGHGEPNALAVFTRCYFYRASWL